MTEEQKQILQKILTKYDQFRDLLAKDFLGPLTQESLDRVKAKGVMDEDAETDLLGIILVLLAVGDSLLRGFPVEEQKVVCNLAMELSNEIKQYTTAYAAKKAAEGEDPVFTKLFSTPPRTKPTLN